MKRHAKIIAILYTKNTLYICKHEGDLKQSQIFKHTLHTSLLRGMDESLHSKSLFFEVLFFGKDKKNPAKRSK